MAARTRTILPSNGHYSLNVSRGVSKTTSVPEHNMPFTGVGTYDVVPYLSVNAGKPQYTMHRTSRF